MNTNIEKTQIFHKMNYDFKGHPRSYKTTFMPKSNIRLWTDFDENLYEMSLLRYVFFYFKNF